MPTLAQTPSEIESIVCSYDWPCGQALSVMRCESSGDPMAYSAGNYGLFQLSAVHAGRVGGDPRAFFDAEVNVKTAFQIWTEQGWRPWACKP